MDKTVENHLTRIENIKCKLTDFEYKELIESLRDMHKFKENENKPKLYKMECAYPKFCNSSITFIHTSDDEDENGILNLYGKVDCNIDIITIYIDFQKLIENNLDKLFLDSISKRTFPLFILKEYISYVETEINITCNLQEISDFDNNVIPDTSMGEFKIKIENLKVINYDTIY